MTLKTVLSFLVLLLSLPVQANELPAEQLYEKISPSIWVVHTFDRSNAPLSNGSAVVIDSGLLITNCHVLAKAVSVVIKRDNVTYDANLKHADPERDLCQLAVRGFQAPAVEIVPTESLKIGQRVYAIGNPRGLELTLSDGLISGLRLSKEARTVELIQTSTPLSPGSSGGGLFDTRGRLVGVTTSGLRDSQNLNFAMPASWIAEVPERSEQALAARSAARSSAGGMTTSTAPITAKNGAYHIGQQWEYTIIDKMTNVNKTVVLQVDRFDQDTIVFNAGTRSETHTGRIVKSSERLLSELDNLNQLGGWVTLDKLQQISWPVNSQIYLEPHIRLDLTARNLGESKVTVPAGEFDVNVVKFSGYRYIDGGRGIVSTQYEATAWYSKQFNRIIRFSAVVPGATRRIHEDIVLQRLSQ
jgi:serine protease Do